ncbi:Golgi apparatus protein 1-like [Dysidea avara]|uniref:Golgi apparatus protein 1-like n=1 Tax=Dysidea avara TaxID=196820 RepID=UPI003322B129
MMNSLVCLVLVASVAIHAATDNTTLENPGYDITPLKERVISDQAKKMFKEKTLISANPICQSDAATLCPATSSDNLLLLPCMQIQAERVSPMCHQVLWKYKVYLTTVGGPLLTHCESPFRWIPGCKKANPYNGEMVACILDNKKNITDRDCQLTLFRMQKVIFSDHRLIYGFNKACGQDIVELKCGRVERNETLVFDTGTGQQGLVVSCLEDNIDHLSADCLKQIYKKEVVAAESIELDAALAQACQLEVSVMCKSIPPGKGNLYRCLFDHMNEPTMKSKCRRQLMRRGKEESQDYRMDYKFTTACSMAIKRYNCDKEAYTEGSFTKTVNILRCLNNLATQEGALTDDCKAEMATMVTLLMGNYQLDMTLAAACDVDVADHCTMEKNTRQGGGVIACLMTMEKKMRLSDPCSIHIQQLVAAALPTFTQAVDHITRQRCQTLYKETCGDLVSQHPTPRRFSCLMDHANDQGTDPICRNHLLTLQYFLARDYRMDQPLRDACQYEANEFCSLNYKQSSMEYPPARVLHCLYTSYLNPATKDEISLQCVHEVQRVMLIRSSSVDLNPYIEKSCMADLSFFCGVDTAIPGEEFKCLQENMENLSDECHDAIGSWTKMESQNIEMNQPLFRACRNMIKKYCEEFPRGSGEIIHCLASVKNVFDFSEQCRKEVTDYQTTILQKYEYDPAFIQACGHDAHTLCDIEKTKNELMECLKRNSVDLPTACRAIIREEQLEQEYAISMKF